MWPRVVGGTVLGLVGVVWFLQGINLLGGSFMSGHAIWAVFGVILLVMAAALFRAANTLRRS